MAFLRRLMRRDAPTLQPTLHLYRVGPDGVQPVKSHNPLYHRFFDLVDEEADDLTRDSAGLARAYRLSVWAYRCVRVRAQALAAIPLVLKGPDGEALPGHPLSPVFSGRHTKLMYVTESDLQVFGRAFWAFGLDRVTGRAWVRRLNPLTIEVDADSAGIRGFVQRIGGQVVGQWKPHELVMFSDYAPDDDLGGLSPVSVALRAVGVTINISAFSEYFFRNGATPDVILVSQNRLSDSDRERIQTEWRRRFQGVTKSHGTAILEAGLFDVKTLTPPLKDLALAELREEERRDICAALGVPMSIAQAADPALYAAKQDYANFHTLTVLPELNLLVDTINERLVPRYGVRGAYVEPDTSQVEALQEDLAEITQRNQAGVAAGYLSLNEARLREGLDPLPVDAFLIAGQLVSRADIESGRFELLRQQPALPFFGSAAPLPRGNGGAAPARGVIDVVVRNVGPDRGVALVGSALREQALEDLARWQRKAAKKGVGVPFESDYIPVALRCFLRADLLAWDGKSEPEEWVRAAFARAERALDDDDTLSAFEAFWRGIEAGYEQIAALFESYADALPGVVAGALREIGKTGAEQALAAALASAGDRFAETALGPLVDVFLAGAERGEEILDQARPAKAGLGIDWTLVHRMAREWARRYVADLVRGINETTLQIFRTAIADWIERGGTLEDLAQFIEGKLPELDVPEGWSGGKLKWALSRERARLIAQTETTRAFAEGSIARWEQAGVTLGRWRTNNDELVCPICGALNNVVGNLRAGWQHPKTGRLYRPPAHPGCRCFLAPVVEL
ncbi:MAG: hypothetical protein KatS3mg051_1428 [Anaerolineae bacterium]|nr:MAG: hypothetical protein KatS3mg051_1428 [Anaerolineae bacterium]